MEWGWIQCYRVSVVFERTQRSFDIATSTDDRQSDICSAEFLRTGVADVQPTLRWERSTLAPPTLGWP